jgi:hypothetical protein
VHVGRRSLNLELTPLDPNLETNIARAHRAHIEMEDIPRNANQEEQEEYQDARARNERSKDEHMTWISLRHFGTYSH